MPLSGAGRRSMFPPHPTGAIRTESRRTWFAGLTLDLRHDVRIEDMSAQPWKPEASAAPRPTRYIPRIALPLAAITLVAYKLHLGGALKSVDVPHGIHIETADRSTSTAAPRRVASRDFMVGRWEVEQTVGAMSGGTAISYERDGTPSGTTTVFERRDRR